MGQRHQVYLYQPAKYYNPDNINNRPAKVVGIHHQWLYGATAVQSLARALKFHKVGFDPDSLGGFGGLLGLDRDDASRLAAIYTVDQQTGYYHNVIDISKEDWGCCEDPRNGDNNDGCTLIDIEDPLNPKYCFFSVSHLEGDGDACRSVKNLQPMSAMQYLEFYYPEIEAAAEQSENLNKKIFAKEALGAVQYLEEFPVITKQRLFKIFPAFKE